MKTKKILPPNRAGGALVIVMAILVAFSLMVLVLLKTATFNTYEAERDLLTARARWIAEAGVERAKARINTDQATRDTILPGIDFADTLEDPEDFGAAAIGSYRVGIRRDGNEIFYIVSEGTAVSPTGDPMTLTSRVTLEGGSDWLPFALFGAGGNSFIKQSRSIDIAGDIYIEGSGEIRVVVDGEVQDANDDEAVDYVSATVLVEPININYDSNIDYGALLATADTMTPLTVEGTGQNRGTQVEVPYTGPFALGTDGTIYVNGDIEIAENVTGSGTIVATGDIVFNQNDVTLSSDITLVSGSEILVDANGTTFGINTTLLSTNNVHIGGNQNYPQPEDAGPNDTGMTIVALNNVEIEANVGSSGEPFYGLIYAGGIVKLVNGTQEILGSIIAGEGFDIRSNASVTYTNSVYEDSGIVSDNWFATKQEWEQSPF